MNLQTVLSITQAQRVAKIRLMRNRQQGSGTLEMGLSAYRMQPVDVMNFTFPFMGWTDKVLEIAKVDFQVAPGDEGQAPAMRASFDVQETAASVYEWDPASEELTVYDVPAAARTLGYTVAPPTNMSLTSSAATAVVQPDGTVLPRIEVQWDEPLDAFVKQIQMRYQLVGASSWTDGGLVDVANTLGFISGIVAGQQYNVAIRSLRANGGSSAWVSETITAGIVLSVVTQDGIGSGSLTAEAYTNGTAGIECQTFSAVLGNRSVTYFPSGAVFLTGLQQQSLYYVYVADPTVSGGDLTPVATLNQADYLGKLGYFLIGTVITPYAASSGSGIRYAPSAYQDSGTRTTVNPASAYDGDSTTAAVVSGSTVRTTSFGDCIFQGDPAIGLSAASTLSVDASVQVGGAGGTASITAMINGTATSMLSATSTTGRTTYSCTVPANTPLNTITVEVTADPALVALEDGPAPPAGGAPAQPTYENALVSVSIYEIYVQS